MNSQSPQTNCRLFKLPGEIRNRIYRLVLVDAVGDADGYIEYDTTGYSVPPLLKTCKAIRSENRAIFYYENQFTCTIEKFDCSPMVKFWAHLRRCDLSPDKVHTRCGHDFEPDWRNLMEWLRRYHAKDVHGRSRRIASLQAKGLIRATDYIIAGLFDTAKDLRGQPWQFVEGVVSNQHEALIVLDARWKEA
ncbi:hypothetical protein CLAFUW4_13682 [Fulvia fulva]|nr:hypothetical protein CLAFUR4_13685 [Fulvia fulva]KAK4611215.1 hypothetical protein CLAFUR0_13689 [Fulvia fulva]WPV21688.1 hypothetical protein CLAFUW4_13682 [Fulvia fulva]WPV36825.1 hypothetical protein CLAFUW7_13690 [Fulvia fulva]